MQLRSMGRQPLLSFTLSGCRVSVWSHSTSSEWPRLPARCLRPRRLVGTLHPSFEWAVIRIVSTKARSRALSSLLPMRVRPSASCDSIRCTMFGGLTCMSAGTRHRVVIKRHKVVFINLSRCSPHPAAPLHGALYLSPSKVRGKTPAPARRTAHRDHITTLAAPSSRVQKHQNPTVVRTKLYLSPSNSYMSPFSAGAVLGCCWLKTQQFCKTGVRNQPLRNAQMTHL